MMLRSVVFNGNSSSSRSSSTCKTRPLKVSCLSKTSNKKFILKAKNSKESNLERELHDAYKACLKANPEFARAFIESEAIKCDTSKTRGDKIRRVVARQILDSRGNPTVEADVETDLGVFRASTPSGASTGAHEAVEIRDGDKAMYLGRSVLKAVRNVNDVIGPALKGVDPADQRALDDIMIALDGTSNKGRLGANATLAVSMAACKAGASAKGVPLYRHIADLAENEKLILPVPAFNVINGGRHAGNRLAFQEFMVLPIGASSFSEALRMGAEVYHALKALIKARYGQDACNVGDEGGFAPGIASNEEGVRLVNDAINAAGFCGRVKIGVDVASSEFFREEDGTYDLGFKDRDLPTKDGDGERDGERDGRNGAAGSQRLSREQMLALYRDLASRFPIVSIEDPFEQDDWAPAAALTKEMAAEPAGDDSREKVQVVGDDLLCTNPSRVRRGVQSRCVSALLLKVNQIGTVTESIEAVRIAKEAGWGVMTSHRSGETEDTFIADLAVGLATGQIKTGAPCRSERNAKYNQLLRIEEEIAMASETQGGKAGTGAIGPVYAGKDDIWRHIAWDN